MSHTTAMLLAWRRHGDTGQFFLCTTGKPRNELAVTTRARSPHGPCQALPRSRISAAGASGDLASGPAV